MMSLLLALLDTFLFKLLLNLVDLIVEEANDVPFLVDEDLRRA